MKNLIAGGLAIAVLFWFMGCSPGPIKRAQKNLAEAEATIKTAKLIGADRKAPANVATAERYYRMAVRDYKRESHADRMIKYVKESDRLREQASDKALLARKEAEKAIKIVKDDTDEIGQKNRALENKIRLLTEQIEQLENAKAMPSVKKESDLNADAGLLKTENERLKSEISAMKQELENLQDEQKKLKSDQKAMVDDRVMTGTDTVKKPSADSQSVGEPKTEPVKTESLVAEKSLGSAIESPEKSVDISAADPKDLYRNACKLFHRKKYEQSRSEFQKFLELYPGHMLNANVQYWIGETYFKQKKYEMAADAYNAIMDNFPDSPIVADAMLNMGVCYQHLKVPEKSKDLWQSLIERYPGSRAAISAKKYMLRQG